jgi:phage FluMu protein Com
MLVTKLKKFNNQIPLSAMTEIQMIASAVVKSQTNSIQQKKAELGSRLLSDLKIIFGEHSANIQNADKLLVVTNATDHFKVRCFECKLSYVIVKENSPTSISARFMPIIDHIYRTHFPAAKPNYDVYVEKHK